MKKNILIFSLSVFLLAVSLHLPSNAVHAGSHSNWEFVYENDANGNAVSGDIIDLINAISQGADVKVMGFHDIAGIYTAVADWVGVTPSDIVYMRHETSPGTVDSSGIPSLHEDTKQAQIFRSDGVREILRYNSAGTTIIKHENITHRMKWFVNK